MGELLQSKPDGFASSLGEGAFGKERKLYRTAKGPISEGAVTEGDWRIKLPPRGSWRAYARLRGFSLEEIGRIVYYIVLWNI